MATLKTPVGEHDHSQGREDAPVTLVEYGDYECPYCGRAYPIVKQVQEQFGARLRFVFRNFPLIEAHPHAEEAAESAEFAAASGKFWPMHDLLFENQRRFSHKKFLELVEQLGLSSRALDRSPRGAVVPGACARGLPQWFAQWSERHADLLHQRAATRRILRLR